MKREEVLLAIIAAGNEIGLTPVKLQKVTFLVSEEFETALPANFYAFDKCDFGPYCADISRDAEMLEYWGQVDIVPTGSREMRKYLIANAANFCQPELPPKLSQFIIDTVEWAQAQSFEELVRSIYFMYPEYRANSVFPYSYEEAFLESLDRGIKQYKTGKTYDARERLNELRREMELEELESNLV